MSESLVKASLNHDGNAVPAGPTVSVGSTGLTLSLDVPSGVELLRAELFLQAPGDDVSLALGMAPPAVTVVTSTSETRLPSKSPVEWFTVDWGVRRPLTFLKVLADPSNDRQGRLKVSEGGPWFSPSPLDMVVLSGATQQLPGVMASRVMVELVAPVDASRPVKEWKPSSATVKEVGIQVAARPVDLSATMSGTQSPFFLHPLPLLPGQSLLLRDELTSALREAWPENLQGGKVDVLLRSSAPGVLREVRLTLETATVVTAWGNGAPSLRLALEPGQEESRPLSGSSEYPLRSFELAVESHLRQERVPLTPVAPAMPEWAQRCAPTEVAAQAFSCPRGNVLAGVDLHLRLLSRTAKGRVSLHADAAGEPEVEPLASASVELALEAQGAPPWTARWVPVDLPTPVPVAAGWWVVLTLSEGEVLWSLDARPAPLVPATPTPLGRLFRLEDDPWRGRVPPSSTDAPKAPWALCRPRFFEPVAPVVPSLFLRWGDSELELALDEEGRIALEEQALEALEPTAAHPLEVVVRSPASGELTLSGLRVTSARRDTSTLFTPTPKSTP